MSKNIKITEKKTNFKPVKSIVVLAMQYKKASVTSRTPTTSTYHINIRLGEMKMFARCIIIITNNTKQQKHKNNEFQLGKVNLFCIIE